MWFKVVVGASAAAILLLGGYAAYEEYREGALARAFDENFSRGDYLAALGMAGKLRASGALNADPVLAERVTEAARLLLAEDALRKARAAAVEERFADAVALLLARAARSRLHSKRVQKRAHYMQKLKRASLSLRIKRQ